MNTTLEELTAPLTPHIDPPDGLDIVIGDLLTGTDVRLSDDERQTVRNALLTAHMERHVRADREAPGADLGALYERARRISDEWGTFEDFAISWGRYWRVDYDDDGRYIGDPLSLSG